MASQSLTTVIPLDYPVEYNSETVSKLTMRRPITNDEIRKSQRKKSGLTEQEVQTQMFADMCSVDYDLLCLTDLVDQQAMVEAYEGFFPQRVKDDAKSQTQTT